MPSCERCGRDSEDGATLEESLEDDRLLCVVCRYTLNERSEGRRADQASLDEYT